MRKDLAAVIKSGNWKGAPVIFKDDREMAFLISWLDAERESESSPLTETLHELVFNCSKCPDIRERKKGFGSGKNRIMIILNAPQMVNRVEMSIHRSESADLLRKMIKSIDFELEDCYTTNLIKCESGDSFTKPSDMVKHCIDFIPKEIEYFRPEIILVMGELLPFQSVIKKSEGIHWFNTDHPVSLIKNPDLKKTAWLTLKTLKAKYREIVL